MSCIPHHHSSYSTIPPLPIHNHPRGTHHDLQKQLPPPSSLSSPGILLYEMPPSHYSCPLAISDSQRQPAPIHLCQPLTTFKKPTKCVSFPHSCHPKASRDSGLQHHALTPFSTSPCSSLLAPCNLRYNPASPTPTDSLEIRDTHDSL